MGIQNKKSFPENICVLFNDDNGLHTFLSAPTPLVCIGLLIVALSR